MSHRVTCRFIGKADAGTLNGIITIYRAQGWWKPADRPALLKKIIRGSHCFAVAELDGRLIGIGRAISDGVSDAYIQDVAVLKSERHWGAGSAIMKTLQARLKRDGIGWLGLIAQDKSEPFYLKLGFKTLKNAAPMLAKGSNV